MHLRLSKHKENITKYKAYCYKQQQYRNMFLTIFLILSIQLFIRNAVYSRNQKPKLSDHFSQRLLHIGT